MLKFKKMRWGRIIGEAASITALAVFPTLLFAGQSILAQSADTQQTQLANSTYRGVEDVAITLTDGRWEGQPFDQGGASRPSVGLAEDFVLRGDLNADGVDERVVLLWRTSGGSGTFDYLAVMAEADGEFVNLATAPLGDRVQIRSGKIVDGLLELDVVQPGEGDAACCPGQLATRSWILDGAALLEQVPVFSGSLDLSILLDTQWELVDFDIDADFAGIAVPALAFEEARISGHGGCNRYSAAIEAGPAPGDIRVGPVSSTRMACTDEKMRLESTFLDQLGHVSNFSFTVGKLVLSGYRDSGAFRLAFKQK